AERPWRLAVARPTRERRRGRVAAAYDGFPGTRPGADAGLPTSGPAGARRTRPALRLPAGAAPQGHPRGMADRRVRRDLPSARRRDAVEGEWLGARDRAHRSRLLEGAGGMRALVTAKAPVAGRVKTRLGTVIGMETAARVAAAALLDTLVACRAAFDECHLALDGTLTGACEEDALRAHLDGWVIHPQRGASFGERLAHAHADAAGPGPTVQVGMDTPQVTVADLREVAAAAGEGNAVLGPAPA